MYYTAVDVVERQSMRDWLSEWKGSQSRGRKKFEGRTKLHIPEIFVEVAWVYREVILIFQSSGTFGLENYLKLTNQPYFELTILTFIENDIL